MSSIARFVSECGYTEVRLKQLGLVKTPWRFSKGRLFLPYKLPKSSALGLLVRLFFFGESVSAGEAARVLPLPILESMLACGMVEQVCEDLQPNCTLTHFDNLLLACDSVRKAQNGSTADLVLGVNTPTRLLARCLMPVQEAKVLDLGTGCGTLALKASPSASSVTATDINERALAFTQFNAALNGLRPMEVSAGDRFEPVKGRTFDLIICNPPFFLTPVPRLLFTDNNAELDSFVESLARTCPAFLKEGGFFQMLCEWVQREGEPWPNRLRRWFADSGCDVLVLKAYEIDVADYVQKRDAEAGALHGESDAETLLGRIAYFEEKKVQRIFGGLITVRKRKAANWFICEEMSEMPTEPIGELIQERFQTHTVLAGGEKSRLLTAKPQISRFAALLQESALTDSAWVVQKTYLQNRLDPSRRLAFDSGVMPFLGQLNGQRTTQELIDLLAEGSNGNRQAAAENCFRLLDRLASHWLLTF